MEDSDAPWSQGRLRKKLMLTGTELGGEGNSKELAWQKQGERGRERETTREGERDNQREREGERDWKERVVAIMHTFPYDIPMMCCFATNFLQCECTLLNIKSPSPLCTFPL